jgi:hypothetical protein
MLGIDIGQAKHDSQCHNNKSVPLLFCTITVSRCEYTVRSFICFAIQKWRRNSARPAVLKYLCL